MSVCGVSKLTASGRRPGTVTGMADTAPAPGGWASRELAALHIAGVPPRRLRTLLIEYPTAAAYRAAHEAGDLPDLPPLATGGELTGLLPEGVWVTAVGEATYPHQLAVAPAAPLLLYGRGDPAALTAGIAVVGTRRMTELGRIVAGLAVTAAATVAAPVHSGLAAGVDRAAAEAALAAGIPTVAVLAAGVNHPTPVEHADLARQIIAAGGAVVSEQPPGYDPAAAPRGDRRYISLLQARNRIIAGLASVVVPCEGGTRSGTVGAVFAALAAGRPVVVAEPRAAAQQLPGAQLPLLLASTRARSVADLTRWGMPGPLAERHAGRAALASGVARDRDELIELIRLAHQMSPWRAGGSPTSAGCVTDRAA